MLITCEIRPGASIHIADLADRLRVSPTPVREALNRLLVERLVIRNMERGFCSRSFDPVEQRDLVLVRAMLVTGAVRQLVGPSSKARIADREPAEHVDSARAESADASVLALLHEVQVAIVRRTGSRELETALQGLLDRSLPSVRAVDEPSEREWARSACAMLLAALDGMQLERAQCAVDEIARYELETLAADPTSNEAIFGSRRIRKAGLPIPFRSTFLDGGGGARSRLSHWSNAPGIAREREPAGG